MTSGAKLDGRYKLTRHKFSPPGHPLAWVQVAIERYQTKGAAMAAYARARTEDGAWPDLQDDKTGEFIA